jgi:non-specific protein-tyrosine kinase
VFRKTDKGLVEGPGSLVMLASPSSAAAEAYRTLRLNLQYASVDAPLQALLVASASADEGRTTVAANLAIAAAEAGRQVVLADCDLREPAVHQRFGLSEAPGLTELLIDELDPAPLRETATPGLRVLTAGRTPPNPGELVASRRLASTLASLRTCCELLILDSPPVGVVGDAAVLATLVDGVLFVARTGRTKRDDARRAREQLDRVGARLLGTVLTNARLDRDASVYHSTR